MAAKKTVETMLETLYTAPAPSPDFVENLEAELLQPKKNNSHIPTHIDKLANWWRNMGPGYGRFPSRRLVLAFVLLGVLTAGILSVPSALATVQQWLGYIPSVGFVDTTAARRLTEPVSQSQAGITVTVTDLIATADKTYLLVSVTGLPAQAQTLQTDPDQLGAALLLEDGTEFTANEIHLNPEHSWLIFDALPANTSALIFKLEQLPIVNMPQKNWEFTLQLDAETSSLATPLLLQYQLEGVQETQQGITVRVDEVAHVAEQTAVSLSLAFNDSKYQVIQPLDLGSLSVIGTDLPALIDEQGNVYETIFDPNGSQLVARRVEATSGEATIAPTPEASEGVIVSEAFAPVNANARQLTLTIHGLALDLIVDETAPPLFILDVGDAPQIGSHFPLDVSFKIDNLPVQLTGATIIQQQLTNAEGTVIQDEVALAFDVVPVVAENGRILHSFTLTNAGFQGSSGGSSSDGTRNVSLTVPSIEQFPTGQLAFRLDQATIGFLQEWQLSWKVPPH